MVLVVVSRVHAFFSCLLCVASLLGGCTAAPRPEPPERPAELYWPSLPEQPRFVYEATLRDSGDVERRSETEALRRLVGAGGDETRRMAKPYGIAAREGKIYVTDTVRRVVHVFDIPRRRFFQFGFRFEGQLAKPLGVAVDDELRVYVADVGTRRVVVYDHFGLFLRAIGGREDLQRPTAVAVAPDGSRVYVVDSGGVDSDQHRVVVYDAAGERLAVIGRRGKEAGEFNLPNSAAVARDGTLYVLDAGNFRVQAFSPDGRLLRAWGEVGDAPGQFARPKHVAVDADGNVYVSDASFGNVQIFDSSGRLLLAIGKLGREDVRGRYALPSGLAVDETGRLYVLDQVFNRVDVIRRLGDEEGRAILQSLRR